MKFVQTLFFFSIFLVLKACPPGTVQGVSENICYLPVSTPASWFAAEYDCARNGGHLGSIESAFEQAFYVGLADESFNESKDFWLGLSSAFGSDWEWADGNPFNFSRWNAGKSHTLAGFQIWAHIVRFLNLPKRFLNLPKNRLESVA